MSKLRAECRFYVFIYYFFTLKSYAVGPWGGSAGVGKGACCRA